jgi:hypothetical protein
MKSIQALKGRNPKGQGVSPVLRNNTISQALKGRNKSRQFLKQALIFDHRIKIECTCIEIVASRYISEHRMSKDATYFDIHHSLFDIRYSIFFHSHAHYSYLRLFTGSVVATRSE